MAEFSLKALREGRLKEHLAGLGVDLDIFQRVKPEDVVYLQDHCYPCIQIVNTTGSFPEDVSLEFITSRSGWKIFCYEDAICTSFNYAVASENETGTIIAQTVATAEDIVEIILDKGWGGIEIVDGSPFLRWALCLAAQAKEVLVEGVKLSIEEQERFERARKFRESLQRQAPELNL